MKQYFAAVLTVLLCMPVVLAAQDSDAEAKQQESSVAKDSKKASADGAPKSEEMEVVKTPFGTVTRPVSREDPEPKGPPPLWLFEIEEKGTAVTFKKKTPFGVTSWTKQQADLTGEERQLIAAYKASKASGNTAAKPAAETAKPDGPRPAKVKSKTTENKKH
jgi:hypothetical protein